MMALKGQMNDEVVLRVAGSVGLDVTRLKSDMAAADIDAAIQHDYDLAQALEIKGTPAFVIGSEVAPGAADIATLKQMVAAARKPG
jgi:protein-disulfide isomerase